MKSIIIAIIFLLLGFYYGAKYENVKAIKNDNDLSKLTPEVLKMYVCGDNKYFPDIASPTPTQKPKSTYEPILPDYCYSVIQAWESMGYNRSQANQMMKKDTPECSL